MTSANCGLTIAVEIYFKLGPRHVCAWMTIDGLKLTAQSKEQEDGKTSALI